MKVTAVKLGFALSVCLLVSGCGSSGPYEYVKVSGKITYEDDSIIPADSIRVSFVALDRGSDMSQRPRPGKTTLNVADGTFESVTSYKYGDGLIPGKHKVAVLAIAGRGRPSQVIPVEYTDTNTSPIVVDTDESPFHIRIPKP